MDRQWYTHWVSDATSGTSLTFTFDKAFRMQRYDLMSSNSLPQEDPTNWILEASSDGGETWVELDSQKGVEFTLRHQQRGFAVVHPEAYSLYRLTITATFGGIEGASSLEPTLTDDGNNNITSDIEETQGEQFARVQIAEAWFYGTEAEQEGLSGAASVRASLCVVLLLAAAFNLLWY
jgi:hypothetical protein